MSAARNLTDADAERIAELVVEKLRRRDVAPSAAPPVLSRERREAAIAKSRAILKRRGIRSGHGPG